MKQFLVTIKYDRDPRHDPSQKKTGMCPANPGKLCTDITGQHHTLLWEGESLFHAQEHWQGMGLHVTRIEEV